MSRPNVEKMLEGVSIVNQNIGQAADVLKELNADYLALNPEAKDRFVSSLHSDSRSKTVLKIGIVPHPFD